MIKLVSVKLLHCFCDARKTQAYYTKCLDTVSTAEEKQFLLELVSEATKNSNRIKELCLSILEDNFYK